MTRKPSTRALASHGSSVRSVNYATSPLLASKTPPWRSRFVVALVGAAFLLLLGRAVWLQIWATDFYQAQGEKRFVHKQPLPASRGRILDRNGLVLATSVALPSVQVDLKTFAADTRQRKEMARLLGMTTAELADRVGDGSGKDGSGKDGSGKDGSGKAGNGAVMLRRMVDEPVWQQVKALKIKGVDAMPEYKRRYPEGEAAAHVVGFTDVEDKGQEGIELGFQKQLLGQAGQRTVVRDRVGRVVEDVGEQASPVNGRDITLSVDSKVQFFAYQRVRDAVRDHKAKAGSVVVLDVLTGEVLALANFPSYDPAERKSMGKVQLAEAGRNRAITDVFEPGSTMKPLVVALALETGRVKVDTVINTAAGSLVVGPKVISDSHPHPSLTVEQVIQKSSNVGAARIAMGMPARELWDLFSSIGYGQKPKIEFPGAVTGRLKAHKNWKPVEQATMAYGYGLSASLLQMARAYTPLARDGDVIPVTMLRHDPQAGPVDGLHVLSPATVRAVRKMLQMAAGDEGTARKAQTIGYSVGGKSGTAHKQEGKGYAATKYRSWFVGMAPINAPRIIVAVMVDEPSNGAYFGGEVAAPVFSQVVQQTLRMMNVAPDIEVKAQISARPDSKATGATESF